jgi:YegS/Rv2252/BmrU family lipid kinase
MPAYKIIVNPISGRGRGGASIPIIRQLLDSLQLSYELVQTEEPWHAATLAEKAVQDGFVVVVAAGGDGTANEVLNGLMKARENPVLANHQTAMGILCVGRGNDFAFGMGVPTDLEAGCKLLAQNNQHTVDVGRVYGGDYPQGRYFGNGVGIGFDAVVGFEALKMKRLSGFPSYIVAALKTIFLYFHAPLVRISFNGESIQQAYLMISIMNGRRMGGGFMMAPTALQDDSLFDLCLVRQVSRSRVFSLIPHFMHGTQATQPEIQNAQTNCIEVKAVQGYLPVHADGETISTQGTFLRVEILPGKIQMVCQSTDQ